MEWEQRSIAARTFLLVKFSSFEKNLCHGARASGYPDRVGHGRTVKKNGWTSNGAGLGERAHEGSAMTDFVHSERTSSEVLFQFVRGRPELRLLSSMFVLLTESSLTLKTNWAAGVLWAVVFQVGMLIAIAAYCTLHNLLR
jgi:hypothetical protein